MAKPITVGEKIARDLCEMDDPIDNIIGVDAVDVARRIDEEVFSILDSLADCAFRNERLVANYAEVQEENNTLRRIHAENLAIKGAEIAQSNHRFEQIRITRNKLLEGITTLQAENAALKEQVAQREIEYNGCSAMLNNAERTVETLDETIAQQAAVIEQMREALRHYAYRAGQDWQIAREALSRNPPSSG